MSKKLDDLIEILYEQGLVGRERTVEIFTDGFKLARPGEYAAIGRLNLIASRVSRLYDYFGLEDTDVKTPQIRRKKKEKNNGRGN